jgi:hypothetical protein
VRARTFLASLAFAIAALAPAQKLTSPEAFFGHEIGADYVLTNYVQFTAYMTRLAGESPRMTLQSIGKTEEGREQLMAIVTSPENHKRLERYREIAARLARAEGLTDEQARALAKEGKAVVWIDGGLHATEVLVAQQLMETCWRMVSGNDEETLRILDDVIILFVHANPDGMDLVSDWYMRNPNPRQRSYANLPRLYQKYIGHDNNRDFYMVSQKESENMNRILYKTWYPQIMYNHHQTAPRGTVMFAPPFREPFNHHFDPLVVQSLELVGANMHRRMIEEGKAGTTQRGGASFSTWWNGGLRTTAYFHNIVGILTETIGHPNPMRIPLVPDRLIPQGTLPFPIEPREWKFRESVEYSHTANMSILDLASRYREEFLYNIYQMGRNSIQRGRQDSWTHYPSRVAAAQARAREEEETNFMQALKAPELRDARAYILPINQDDFPTAVKFANALIKAGVTVHRATANFELESMSAVAEGPTVFPRKPHKINRLYYAGTLVVRADQAFRPHILDMFEPQDHPNDIPAPGAAPIPPYDNAGWTLAFQMGIEFDRVLDGLPDGLPLEPVDEVMAPPPGSMHTGLLFNSGGLALDQRQNDAYRAVARLLTHGASVERLGNGRFVVTRQGRASLADLTRDLGISAVSSGKHPPGAPLRAPRVGLWDRYGGSMPSGWTRWIFEQFEIPFNLVFAKELDAGNLREKYDVLIFPTGAIPARGNPDQTEPTQTSPRTIPEEFHHMLGSVSVANTVPKLREFLEQGGTIIAIGSSTVLGTHLGLPIEDHLVDDRGRALQRAEYFVPTSVLRVRVDNKLPIAWGMGEHADVMFSNSPVFRIPKGSAGIRPIAWFDTDRPLRSGWAWGQEKLQDGVTMLEAEVGKGKLYLFGPEVLFRAQPHGTFKLVFNGIFNSTAAR